ncbi:peptidylprolyl isomerase [Trueperella bonasi]|uniref:Peptidyl-prolyl cis-trans isomerase n=1 Tax=Trueperella bonasi TaxID=312286 RepID=A0ABT9NJ96_9ACTO|nr:FKBP-type peptidyl-prolyl cis-trans isomerase [Trueperella bonasi]MDP9807103.1 peptidylprolyl isomerase [Trueperella bonasi]
MTRKLAVLPALALIFSLVACSSDEDPEPNAEPSPTATEKVIEYGTDMPELDTSGENPTLAFPGPNPVEGLQVEVLEEGSGREIESQDVVVAHYVGQVWGSNVPFDSSFKRGEPSSFSLQGVIRGWTEGLTGLKAGTKVIISVPPEYGYGEGGQPAAGIGGTDTIAFYVEVVTAFGVNQAGDAAATIQVEPDDLPIEIDGELGEPIEISVRDDAEEPEGEPVVTVIARGSGDPLGGEGTTLYHQYSMSLWDNSMQEITYGQHGPQQLKIGGGSFFDALEGVPVGSRVLVEVPANDGGEGENVAPAYAVVIDVIDQVPAN